MKLDEVIEEAKNGAIVGRHIWRGRDARWNSTSHCLVWVQDSSVINLTTIGALADDWFVKIKASELEPEAPPDGPTVVGLKFLQEDFGSLNSQDQLDLVHATRVFYPANEWIKVDGSGCFVGVGAGEISADSLFSGGVGPVLAFFEARIEVLASSPPGVQTYRWGRRLTKPCPERLGFGFREWLRDVKRDGFTDEHRAFATGVPWPEPEPVIEEWLLVSNAGCSVCFAHPSNSAHSWQSPTHMRAKRGFIDFDIKLPDGRHHYEPDIFRQWWSEAKQTYSPTYGPVLGHTQEVIARAARVLKGGDNK